MLKCRYLLWSLMFAANVQGSNIRDTTLLLINGLRTMYGQVGCLFLGGATLAHYANLPKIYSRGSALLGCACYLYGLKKYMGMRYMCGPDGVMICSCAKKNDFTRSFGEPQVYSIRGNCATYAWKMYSLGGISLAMTSSSITINGTKYPLNYCSHK